MYKSIIIFIFAIGSAVSFAEGAKSPVNFEKDPLYAIPEKRDFPTDKKVSPCEDFHAYVCNKVESSFHLRPDRSLHDFAFSDSRERILQKRKAFVRALPTQEHLTPYTEQVRRVYLACLDPAAKAVSEKQEVQKLTAEVEKLADLKDMMTWANRGLSSDRNGFFHIGTAPNQDEPLLVNAVISSSLMRLPDHKYYQNAELLHDYELLLTEFFQDVLKESSPKANKRAKEQIQLQKDFIVTYPISSVRHDRWSEKHDMEQEKAIKKFPNLQLDMVTRLFPHLTILQIPITESLQFLNADLPKRPLQVWKDYLILSNLESVLDDAYPEFYAKKFAFDKKYFGGPSERPVREERCTNLITGLFPRELDSAMLDEVFPEFDEGKVRIVIDKIRASIEGGLKANTWLSGSAQKEALNKIHTARLQLVRPHTEREWDFSPLRIYSETDHLQNMHTFAEARFSKTLYEMTEPTNLDAWGMGPLTINAYYSENENKFVLPIGILQYPFFDKDGDLIENLGAVGAVTGHELGHSIDNHGSKFDAGGHLRSWMSSSDLKEFEKRGESFSQQFAAAGLDGKLTLGENVADLVGLTFAYQAAFPDGKVASDSDKKRFYESYARLWCLVGRPEYRELLKKIDPHSSGESRINEQVKHQTGFVEAYQCKAGDKMYIAPENRLKIW